MNEENGQAKMVDFFNTGNNHFQTIKKTTRFFLQFSFQTYFLGLFLGLSNKNFSYIYDLNIPLVKYYLVGKQTNIFYSRK